jgi:hypothetical protein
LPAVSVQMPVAAPAASARTGWRPQTVAARTGKSLAALGVFARFAVARCSGSARFGRRRIGSGPSFTQGSSPAPIPSSASASDSTAAVAALSSGPRIGGMPPSVLGATVKSAGWPSGSGTALGSSPCPCLGLARILASSAPALRYCSADPFRPRHLAPENLCTSWRSAPFTASSVASFERASVSCSRKPFSAPPPTRSCVRFSSPCPSARG